MNKAKKIFTVFKAALIIFLISCQNPIPRKQRIANDSLEKYKSKIEEQFVSANKQIVQKENDEMDFYEKSHKLEFTRTTSGVRYFVYKHSEKGDSIKDEMRITIDYEVSLLDGTSCYSSAIDGKKEIVVGGSEAESGIHKGLHFIKRGDKALFLIPSALAHGLLGDMKKIPPQMPICYDVAVH